MIRKTLFGGAIVAVMATAIGLGIQARCERNAAYQYTKDWTTRNEVIWTDLLGGLAGAPNIHALEIGAYEGRSTIWLLDHILTGEGSTITVVDPWEHKPHEKKFNQNIEVSGHKAQVIAVKGYSQEELPTLRKHAYNLIYIDGCHDTTCVHLDTAYSWRLLAPGGILIWDDAYSRGPSPAVNHFLDVFRGYFDTLYHASGESPEQRDFLIVIQKNRDDHYTRGARKRYERDAAKGESE